MVKRELVARIELVVEQIELPVEGIGDVPGAVEHPPTAHRLWTAVQRTAQAAADERSIGVASSASEANVTFLRSTTFRRLVELPGARLETVLDAWWSRSGRDDGHLRFGGLARDDGAFELDGWLRISAASKPIPVGVRLSPYLRCWTFLELTPRRATHPSRAYFRVGHASLDRFEAALTALV